MIIIEYIEETWLQNPLLPYDPYQRALTRFWVKFADDKSFVVWTLLRSSREEQEKAKNESLEVLKTIEEHGHGEKKFFGGEEIGIVDIAFGWMAIWLGVIEEKVGVKLLEAHIFPRLYAWTKNFKEVPVIKQNLPDRHELLLLFKEKSWDLLLHHE